MFESLLLLCIIGGLLFWIFLFGIRIRGVMGAILVAQTLYWSVSYMLRPIVLISVQPLPRANDSIADWRIATGGYEVLLPSLLRPIVCGLLVYVVIVMVIVRFFANTKAAYLENHSESIRMLVPVFTVAYFAGWLFRIIDYSGHSSALVLVLADLAAVGSGGLLIWLRTYHHFVLLKILVILGSEFIWSILSTSKTPVIAAGLAIAFRCAMLGWTRRRIVLLTFGAVVGLLTFPLLQSFKLSASTAQDLGGVDEYYPVALRPLLSLVRRFDLFSAVTDSVLLGPGQWLDAYEIWRRIWQSFVPQIFLGQEKVGVGTLWSTEVRASSLGVINEQVSLAEGFVAEGYALYGYLGVVVGAAFMAVLSCMVSRMISSKHVFVLAVGLLMLAYPVLFERGVLASFEVAGKSVQTVLVFLLIYTIVRSHLEKMNSDLGGSSRTSV